MLSVGVGEIQKNTSIFTNLKEVIQIIDKRKKQVLALVYPMTQRQSIINDLAGKYKNKIKTTKDDFKHIKEHSMSLAMEEKYGLSS